MIQISGNKAHCPTVRVSCSLSVNSGGRRCPGVLLGTLETMGLTGAEEHQPSLSLVYISSCFAGDNGENDSVTRDLPNNDSRPCADNTSGSLRLANAGAVSDQLETAQRSRQLLHIYQIN